MLIWLPVVTKYNNIRKYLFNKHMLALKAIFLYISNYKKAVNYAWRIFQMKRSFSPTKADKKQFKFA